MIKRLFAVSLLCLGSAVCAQTVVGKVVEVKGIVTVSDGVTVGTAVPGTPVAQGNRFVTASSGFAKLSIDNGCDITLQPNQALTIGSDRSCKALLAAVQPVTGAPALAGAPLLFASNLGAGAGAGTGLLIGGTIAAVGLVEVRGGAGPIPTLPISGQ